MTTNPVHPDDIDHLLEFGDPETDRQAELRRKVMAAYRPDLTLDIPPTVLEVYQAAMTFTSHWERRRTQLCVCDDSECCACRLFRAAKADEQARGH